METKELQEMSVFATEYIKENNPRLYKEMQSCFLNEDRWRDEIYLEIALYLGANKAFLDFAFQLIEIYEENTIRQDGTLIYLVWAVREFLMRTHFVLHQDNVKHKRLYVLLMENDTVKIGIASDVKRRITQIQSSSGMIVKECLYTDVFDDAHNEELLLHKKYKDARKKGEYFSIPYRTAKEELRDVAMRHCVDVFEKE